jgi:hypothetical protein
MAVGGGHELLGLGHGQGGEEIRIHLPEGPAQPDIEEVRQVRVAMLS